MSRRRWDGAGRAIEALGAASKVIVDVQGDIQIGEYLTAAAVKNERLQAVGPNRVRGMRSEDQGSIGTLLGKRRPTAAGD